MFVCFHCMSMFVRSPGLAMNVTAFCADRLMQVDDVWEMKSLHVYQTLNDSAAVIDAWIQVCDSLTRLFWPNYARHTWMGDAHTPKTATAFARRLDEIQAIRNVYKEIVCLFNEINQIDKSVRRMFIPFRGFCHFHIHFFCPLSCSHPPPLPPFP